MASGCAAGRALGSGAGMGPAEAKDEAYGLFVIALSHEMRGNAAAAEFGYRKVAGLDSAALHVRYLAANLALQRGGTAEALADIRYVVARDTVADYFSLYGAVLYRLKRYEEAALAYETALKLEPADPRLKEVLAVLCQNLGRAGRAASLYRELMEEHGEPWHAERLARLYLESKEPERALRLIEGMLGSDPSSAKARVLLSGLAQSLPPDSAAAVYRRVIGPLPAAPDLKRDFAAWLIRQERMAEAADLYGEITASGGDNLDRKTYGVLCAHLQRFEKAVELLRPLMAEKPDEDIAYYLGNALLGLKDYEGASECFARAISFDSTNASAWINRGVSFMRRNRNDSAAVVFRSAEGRFPRDAYLNFLAGMAYGSEKRYDKAVEQYRAALAKSPDNMEILFSLAAASERSGDFDAAESLFLGILARDSLNAQVLNYLGYMYADKGLKLDSAAAYILRALSRDPENGAYLDSYGWVLFRQGRIAEAEGYVDRALKAGEKDAVIYEHMAEIQEALGRPAAALEFWRKALESDPENERARNAVSAGGKK